MTAYDAIIARIGSVEKGLTPYARHNVRRCRDYATALDRKHGKWSDDRKLRCLRSYIKEDLKRERWTLRLDAIDDRREDTLVDSVIALEKIYEYVNALLKQGEYAVNNR